MDRVERWNALLEMLGASGRLTVDETAEKLGVSAATVRRDLDQLAQQQMLVRTRGGALAGSLSYDLPLRYRTARNASEKQRIGAAAARMVPLGSVVGLNGGTTTTEAARALASRVDLHGNGAAPGVTVVTNALNIAAELAVRPNVKVVVTGGVARAQSYELSGPLATGILNDLTLDVAVIGVDAVDAASGAFSHHEGEASITQLMVRRARRVIVVADGTKLGRHAFARICPVGGIDVVVTDTGAPDQAVDELSAAGPRVVRV